MLYTSFVIITTFIEISIFLRKRLSYKIASYILFTTYIIIFGIDNVINSPQNKNIIMVIIEPIIISFIFSILSLLLYRHHKEKNKVQ